MKRIRIIRKKVFRLAYKVCAVSMPVRGIYHAAHLVSGVPVCLFLYPFRFDGACVASGRLCMGGQTAERGADI